MEDGYPGVGGEDTHNGQGAPLIEEGEMQQLSEYPVPAAVKLEEGEGVNGD